MLTVHAIYFSVSFFIFVDHRNRILLRTVCFSAFIDHKIPMGIFSLICMGYWNRVLLSVIRSSWVYWSYKPSLYSLSHFCQIEEQNFVKIYSFLVHPLTVPALLLPSSWFVSNIWMKFFCVLFVCPVSSNTGSIRIFILLTELLFERSFRTIYSSLPCLQRIQYTDMSSIAF